jgi:hypothetical protein
MTIPNSPANKSPAKNSNGTFNGVLIPYPRETNNGFVSFQVTLRASRGKSPFCLTRNKNAPLRVVTKESGSSRTQADWMIVQMNSEGRERTHLPKSGYARSASYYSSRRVVSGCIPASLINLYEDL